MNWILIATIIVHVLPAVFWTGATMVLARGAVAPENSLGLRKAQLGAGSLAILAGVVMWGLAHRGSPGRMEMVLAVGAVGALVAATLQAAVGKPAAGRLAGGGADPAVARRLLTVDRLSAALLALALACMVTAKYF